MRFITGPSTIAQESITGKMLMKVGASKPDFIPSIMRLFPQKSALNKILDLKDMKNGKMYDGYSDKNYRVVGSNHVKYRRENTDIIVPHFVSNSLGVSWEDDSNDSDTIGKNKATITTYSSSNWCGYHEIILLQDGETQLWCVNDPEEISDGVFKHEFKINSKNKNDVVDEDLLSPGAEYTVVSSQDIQEFSERGVEKYKFHAMDDAFLSLQRFKYSWSGTAKAMKSVPGRLVSHANTKTFISEAEIEMMRRATEYLNFQYIFGKGSVSDDLEVVMKNERGQELLAGDGVVYSGDGLIRIPYNGFSKAFLQQLVREMHPFLRENEEGFAEVIMMMTPEAFFDFNSFMSNIDISYEKVSRINGRKIDIAETYGYYEFAGVRFIPVKEPALTNRPSKKSSDGSLITDLDVYCLPLSPTEKGNNGVEMIQLRSKTTGTVHGIDAGGNISNSVDGSSTHILFQSGIISHNQMFKLEKPILNTTNYY